MTQGPGPARQENLAPGTEVTALACSLPKARTLTALRAVSGFPMPPPGQSRHVEAVLIERCQQGSLLLAAQGD